MNKKRQESLEAVHTHTHTHTNNLRKEKGITLVALVVTIVVLLILAGVSINLVVGQNGLITRAKEAKKRTEEAINKEEKEFANAQLEINYTEKPKDDDLNPELKKFIAKYNITEDNQEITFPIRHPIGECEIDFGDGVKMNINLNASNVIHQYKEKGEYIIEISGKANSFNYFFDSKDNDKIIQLLQWGTVFNIISFANCTNLTGEIPAPSTNTMKNMTSVVRLFKNTSITGQIPAYLFYGGENIEFAYECFQGCKNLNSLIPETLFQDMKNLKQTHTMFSDSGIKGKIPSNLFKNNEKLESVNYMFSGCENITGTIPGNLFDNNLNIKSFRGIFRKCGISNIESNLFSKNTIATDFVNVFRECYNLKSIPEGLFEKNVEASLFNDCFRECESLESMPANLFSTNTKATNYTETFYSCKKLKGIALNLWNRGDGIIGTKCFFDCTGLSNYENIPDDWK